MIMIKRINYAGAFFGKLPGNGKAKVGIRVRFPILYLPVHTPVSPPKISRRGRNKKIIPSYLWSPFTGPESTLTGPEQTHLLGA